MIKFFVYGRLQGKEVSRFNHDTPPETVKYEKAIKNAYIIACNDLKLESKDSRKPIKEQYRWMDGEPIVIKITAQYAIPKSYTKKRKKAIELGIEQPVKKPDVDSVVKVVCDALSEVAYRDNSQIVELLIEKMYASDGEKEGLWVLIYGLHKS